MIRLAQGCLLARCSYGQLLRLVLRGDVRGESVDGKWWVSPDDCRRLGAERAAKTSAATSESRSGAAA